MRVHRSRKSARAPTTTGQARVPGTRLCIATLTLDSVTSLAGAVAFQLSSMSFSSVSGRRSAVEPAFGDADPRSEAFGSEFSGAVGKSVNCEGAANHHRRGAAPPPPFSRARWFRALRAATVASSP